MSFETDLVTYLETFGVTAYPGHLPQTMSVATTPRAYYALLSADRESMLTGSAGIVTATYRISIACATYSLVDSICERLRQGLQGYRQKLMGDSYIFYALLDDQSYEDVAPVNASDQWTYAKTNDYVISYRESIPSP